jgi:hypothetical protein
MRENPDLDAVIDTIVVDAYDDEQYTAFLRGARSISACDGFPLCGVAAAPHEGSLSRRGSSPSAGGSPCGLVQPRIRQISRSHI